MVAVCNVHEKNIYSIITQDCTGVESESDKSIMVENFDI